MCVIKLSRRMKTFKHDVHMTSYLVKPWYLFQLFSYGYSSRLFPSLFFFRDFKKVITPYSLTVTIVPYKSLLSSFLVRTQHSTFPSLIKFFLYMHIYARLYMCMHIYAHTYMCIHIYIRI